MTIEPPWPRIPPLVEALVLLRTASTVLQREERGQLGDPAIDAAASDVEAAIAKLEAILRSQSEQGP